MVLSPVSIAKVAAFAALLAAPAASSSEARALRASDDHRALAASGPTTPAPFPFIAAEAPQYNNKVLGAMLRQSMHLRKPREGYAVFSWDDTCMAGDIMDAFMFSQMETLNFRIKPSELYGVLSAGYRENEDECMPQGIHTSLGPDRNGLDVTLNNLLRSLVTDYQWLFDNYIGATYNIVDQKSKSTRSPALSLDQARSNPAYNNFRAKLRFYYDALGKIASENRVACAGPLRAETFTNLVHGMTEAEVRELGRSSIQWHLRAALTEQRFDSTDGVLVSGSYSTGLRIFNGQVALMRALRLHHVSVYVIADAPEILLDEIVSMSALSFKVPKAQAFGFRHQLWDGKIIDVARDDVPVPWGPGKRDFIDRVLRPKHGGQLPLFASGASDADCEMLGTVSDGGIVHVVNTLEDKGTCIQAFYEKACRYYDSEEESTRNHYLLQGVNWLWGSWVNSGWSSENGQDYESGAEANKGCAAYNFKK